MDYGKGLQKARKRADLSQRRLALLAGFDASYVSQLEAGKRKPSLEALEKLADALGMPVSVFLLMCADKADVRGIDQVEARTLLAKLLAVLGDRTRD